MSEYSREELLKLLAESSPRTRKTTVRLVEDRVGEDGLAYLREEMSFMQQDQTVRSVELVSSRQCSAGHVLDDKNRIIGRAGCCGAIVCERCLSSGSSGKCSRCGRTLCPRHMYRVAGEEFCSGCRIVAVLRLLVLGGKENGK